MTKQEYQDYERAVQNFIEQEKIEVHSCTTDEEGDFKEPGFSWIQCDCCKSPLGGDRYEIEAGPCVGPIFEYSICPDCLYYLSYGKLDDSTMKEIES